MVQEIIKTVGPGGDHATLAEFAAALPADLVTADQRWVAELWAGTTDPGGAVIQAICDATRYVIVRAAAGQSPGELADPASDPLRPTPGLGALVDAAAGDAIAVAGATTRLGISGLQIVAQAGTALADDGAGAIFSVERAVIEANGSAPAASLRGADAVITDCAVIQRGTGGGVLLADGALAEGCTVAKPPRDLADGTGIAFTGSPAGGARSCIVTGFRQAYSMGAGTADGLASDQTNILAVPDNFADPYWAAISSTVDVLNTVPGPVGVPLQWLGSNQNAFARFDGPAVATLAPGERFAFSLIVAQPTALVSAILLDSTGGRPELRVTWTANPPGVTLLGLTGGFALTAGILTDLGGGTWRLFLEAENTTAAPFAVTPTVYVTRGVENTGLNVGLYAGAVMAGAGHLGTGFVYPGAVPGTNALEGLAPTDAITAVTDGAIDLRPAAAGPLAGAGVLGGGADLYRRHRLAPDTIGAVSLNPATVVTPAVGLSTSTLDPVRLIDQQDILAAQSRRTVLPGGPPRRIGV